MTTGYTTYSMALISRAWGICILIHTRFRNHFTTKPYVRSLRASVTVADIEQYCARPAVFLTNSPPCFSQTPAVALTFESTNDMLQSTNEATLRCRKEWYFQLAPAHFTHAVVVKAYIRVTNAHPSLKIFWRQPVKSSLRIISVSDQKRPATTQWRTSSYSCCSNRTLTCHHIHAFITPKWFEPGYRHA